MRLTVQTTRSTASFPCPHGVFLVSAVHHSQTAFHLARLDVSLQLSELSNKVLLASVAYQVSLFLDVLVAGRRVGTLLFDHSLHVHAVDEKRRLLGM